MPALSPSAGARGSSVFLVGSVGLLRSDKVASCLFDGINYPLFRTRFSYLAFMFKCIFPNVAESRGYYQNFMMHIQDVARLPVHFAPQSDTTQFGCKLCVVVEY